MSTTRFLSPADERSFFEEATEKKMIDYIEKNQMVYLGTERWIINNASIDVLKALFRQQPLSNENELLLIRTRNESVVKEYIMRYPLTKASEELLVSLQREEALQLYEKMYGKLYKEGA